MPPPNTPEPSQQPVNRKRTVSKPVVPAIPLSLSRPRPSKSKLKVEASAKVEDDAVAAGTAPTDAVVVEQTIGPTTNGDGNSYSDAVPNGTLEHSGNSVQMPSSDTPESRGSAAMSISDGTTPEVPTTDSTRPSTPPPAQEVLTTVTPTSVRKPSDRFDMRTLRTELPPLAPTFIPYAEQHTPKSATSSQSNRPPFYPNGHLANASANSIVFGGQDSSTSSPAPPLSAGSAFASPPYANFGGPQQPHFVPHGHSHHASEPHPQRMYMPNHQNATPWNNRQSYGNPLTGTQYFHPHGHTDFRYPPRDVFTPAEPQQPNGIASRSRSASQASSGAADQRKAAQILQSPIGPDDVPDDKIMYVEPKAAFPGHAHPRPSHFHPQMPSPSQYPHPDVTSGLENAESLRNHVLSQLANPSFADCQLRISEELEGGARSIACHRIILSRSPTLYALLQTTESASPQTLPVETNVTLKGQYLRSNAFVEALNYLYGGPLLQLDHHRPSSSAGEQIPSNVDRMENALQYIATGTWLKVPAIATRGVEVAGSLLHWDTISTALTFALDGGLSHIWNVEDGSEDRASTSSSDDSLGRPDTLRAPAYDPFSTHLLQRIIDFTVHVFPPNFYLDASAPQLASCPRLPHFPLTHGSRQSRSDPRLSQIRFGDMTTDDHQRPSFATTTISSVLLSLPFALLKCVLEHYDLAARLGPDTVSSIMRQVVAERETRGTKVLKALVAGQLDHSVDGQLFQNLHWEESVEPSVQHRAGFRIARRRKEIDTPPSSGACSERNK